jgi:glycosyltransferase involved in cell wall biosynthesis
MKKIGIILTSIERDKLLFKSLQSIFNYMQQEYIIILGYQSKDKTLEFSHEQIYAYQLPYNCGLGYAKNDLLLKAVGLGCEYILLTADSICFDESMKNIDLIINEMENQNYDLVGLNLYNRIMWEGKLNLIPNHSFEIDFIDPKEKENQLIIPVDICRNFWIAKIGSISKVPWDNNLIMCGHMDYFWRLKQTSLRVGCTSFCSGTYIKEEDNEIYRQIRKQNFRIGTQKLLKKYNLKTWVSYKHIERIQNEN